MRVDLICRHIVRTTHTPVRVYDKTYVKIDEFGIIHGHEDIFACDPEFEKQLLNRADISCPYLYYEEGVVVYAVIANANRGYYIIGPICAEKPHRDTLDKMKQNHSLKGQYRIPHCALEQFGEEILLLHNLLNDMELTYLQLIEKNLIDEQILHSLKQEQVAIEFTYRENGKLHNPYDRELREAESIRQGDVEKLSKSINEIFSGEYGTLSRNPLQSAKYLSICGLMIASRAAIAGGMPSETALSICDSYILKIDECTRPGQAEAIATQAKFYYAELIAGQHEKQHQNMLIEKCKTIIFKHMHQKITVRDMAEQLHVNPDYLSHLFHREEGIKIHAYVEREKMRLAENMLIYSSYTFEEIGYYLGYSSQSHFGRVFKKWKQLTPKQFRDFHSVKEFNESTALDKSEP